MLTLGADLYTTSKLLGHADVKMTQVYTKIINQKKDNAVNLVNRLFDWRKRCIATDLSNFKVRSEDVVSSQNSVSENKNNLVYFGPGI